MSWCVDVLCVDVLMCWCVDVLMCWSADVLMCWCVDVLMCWCVDVLVCWWCVEVLRCWCVDVLMCWCVDSNTSTCQYIHTSSSTYEHTNTNTTLLPMRICWCVYVQSMTLYCYDHPVLRQILLKGLMYPFSRWPMGCTLGSTLNLTAHAVIDGFVRGGRRNDEFLSIEKVTLKGVWVEWVSEGGKGGTGWAKGGK